MTDTASSLTPPDAHRPAGRGEASWHDYRHTAPIVHVLRRAPVTTLVVAPYALLILPTAALTSNPAIGFIAGVLSFALLGSIAIEMLPIWRFDLRRLSASTTRLDRYGRSLFWIGAACTLLGGMSGLVNAFNGVGTITAQLSSVQTPSSFGTFMTLFSTWIYSGPALLITAFLAGRCSRLEIGLLLGVALALQVGRATLTTITAPLISYLIFLMAMSLYFGLLKVRHCLLIALVVLAIWPTIFALRNQLRTEAGVLVSNQIDAFDRLRYDQQIARAESLPVGLDLGQPSLIEIVRYGVLPRFIDVDRPSISTGALINAYLGGSAKSSLTFLPVTTLYILEGPFQTILFYAGLALAAGLLLRSGSALSPVRIMMFSLILSGPLDWFATYPDSTIGAIQGAIACLPIIAAISLAARHRPAGTSPPPDR